MAGELNEREKTIVDLINNLSVVAEDESTTKEAIDRIMAGIRQKTQENMKAEMEKTTNQPPRPKVEFPDNDVVDGLRKLVEQNSHKVSHELTEELEHDHNRQFDGKLLFTRIREVKTPAKAHPTDAGIDFFVPDKKAWDNDFKETVKKYSRNMEVPNPDGTTFDGLKFDANVLEVSPNAHVAIPSGIKTIIPQGLAMMMVNKSGVATKLKLDHSACLIDSEYRDELIFCFFNHNVEPVKIDPGMKITQGLIVPVIDLKLQECLNCVYDDIAKAGSDRGGGFGSSGTH